MEYRIFIWFFIRPQNHFLYVESYFRFCGKNLNCYNEGHFFTVISLLGVIFTRRVFLRISHNIMICKWEFIFLTYFWLFLDFLECFTIYPLLILKESVGQAKWQRNLGFGTYFLFIITYWLQLRFFENLANQAAMDRIKSKY